MLIFLLNFFIRNLDSFLRYIVKKYIEELFNYYQLIIITLKQFMTHNDILNKLVDSQNIHPICESIAYNCIVF